MSDIQKCDFIVQPYASSSVTSKANTFSLNYTNQDFYSMKDRLIQYSKEQFATKFNDFVESSLAIMLMESSCFLADMLSFKADQVANEVFIDSVAQIDNAFRLAKLVGFHPQPPVGSSAMFSARMNAVQTQDLYIDTPFKVQINSGNTAITYELFPADSLNRPIFDEPIIIKQGQLINSNIVGVQGITYTENFTSLGDVNQEVVLTYLPVIFQSIRIYVNGNQWQQVEYFSAGQPQKEFRVEYGSNYGAKVIFGNNQAGLIPPKGTIIQMIYRVGGGEIGNIVANYVNTTTLVNLQGLPYSASVTLTNYTKGQHGYAGDSIDDIRLKLPRYLATQNRAVSPNDYKTLVDQFTTPYSGTSGKSTVALRTYGCSANIIDIYVLTRSGTDGLQIASNQYKYLLQNYINDLKMMNTYVVIKDGEVIPVEVVVSVVLQRHYQKFQEEIKNLISSKLTIFFNLANWDYGQPLKEVDILKALSDVSQPSSYDITFNTSSTTGKEVLVKFYQIIRPLNYSITFQYQ